MRRIKRKDKEEIYRQDEIINSLSDKYNLYSYEVEDILITIENKYKTEDFDKQIKIAENNGYFK